MAELADAPDLGSGVLDVQVRFLLSARIVLQWAAKDRKVPGKPIKPGFVESKLSTDLGFLL